MKALCFRLAAMLALLAGWMAPGLAQLGSARPHILAELVSESAAPAPGRAVMLAIRWTPEPGWHGYWLNPGDAGLATRAEWSVPAGVRVGPLQYPVPTTLLLDGLMNHVYEAAYATPVRLQLPAGLKPGARLPIRVKLDWLECTDKICVPASGTLSTVLTVGAGQRDGAAAPQFDRWRAALPRPLGSPARYSAANGRFRMVVPLPAAVKVGRPHFFAATERVVDYAAPQRITRNGDALIVETKAAGPVAGPVEGVLRIGEGQGLAIRATPGAVPAAGTALADDVGGDTASGGGFLLALGGALLGGLLLNVMPCVFPILSLKALSLARGGAGEGAARAEAIAYTAGTVALCLVLAGALLALRAGGSAAGWAFQLQDPRVVALLLVLVTAIALNLAGLFELDVIAGGEGLAARGGVGGAFWTGALAAFVATPCSGPFMAGAIGAALLLPAVQALAVFAGLGLGMALPFLLLGFVPALRRRLPRPGAWMARLRRILSVPMFLTALGLAWLLGRQAGVDGMTVGLAAAFLFALGLWIVGRRQQEGRSRRWLPLVPAAAMSLAAALLVRSAPTAAGAAAPAEGTLGGEPFSEARLAALRAEGRPVFVYFTADWCLSCKVNEKAAIDRAETADAFRRGKVAVLIGDWTRGDPVIGRFIEAQGRSGVPLYLWYGAGTPDPKVLPQVLTPGLLAGLVSPA